MQIQETRLRSLRQDNPLEKEMVTHSSILVWEIPWTEEPDGLYIVHGVTKDIIDHASLCVKVGGGKAKTVKDR